jgi:hypothetical protein
MPSKSNFWLTLHQLAHELCKEGDTDDERTSGLIPALESMQPEALAAHLDNLAAVTGSLNHLLARCKVR